MAPVNCISVECTNCFIT